MLLSDLPTEILIYILGYCNVQDVFRLKQTCKLFKTIISTSIKWILKDNALVTNQKHPVITHRSSALLKTNDKWRISHNWTIGKYTEKSLLYERENYLPWLHLERELVWISRGCYVKAYRRKNGAVNVDGPVYILSGHSLSEISKFAVTEDYVVGGQWDGNVWLWSRPEKLISQIGSNFTINSVDVFEKSTVTGCRDGTVSLWAITDALSFDKRHEFNLNDCVWSTMFSTDGSSVSVGTAGFTSVFPLHVLDVATGKFKTVDRTVLRKGAGIIDMKWKDDNTLLTCGYDTHVRRWDLRTGACEQSWEDPYQSTVYCLDTDRQCTIITGTQSHGRCTLFDTRHKKYVQLYFMESCKRRGHSSPAYCVSFDATQLFVVTDRNLNLLDFSSKGAKIRNYSDLYFKEINIFL